MMKDNKIIASIIFIVIISATFLYCLNIESKITVDISTQNDDEFRLYLSSGADFSENKSIPRLIGAGRNVINIDIPTHVTKSKLRIDPSIHRGLITIHHLTISQPFFKDIDLLVTNSNNTFIPANDISWIEALESGNRIISTGNDPQIIANYKQEPNWISVFLLALFCAILSIVLALFLHYFGIGFLFGKSMLTVLLGAAFFAILLISWGTYGNTLATSSQWVVGKNTGKFVFQTFHFLSQSLTGKGIELSGNMGHQELLFKNEKVTSENIQSISFRSDISANGYIWLELDLKGLRMSALRLSRHPYYSSGIYGYNDFGNLESSRVIDNSELFPTEQRGTQSFIVTAISSSGKWDIRFNGTIVGSIPRNKLADTVVAFRGSSSLSKSTLKNVTLTYYDSLLGENVTITEEFSKQASIENIVFILILALVILSLRYLKQRTVSGMLQSEAAKRFLKTDLRLALATSVGILLFAYASSPTIHFSLPLAILLSEMGSVIAFTVYHKKWSNNKFTSGYFTYAFLICTVALFLVSIPAIQDGIKSQYLITKENLKPVHPSAYKKAPGLDIETKHFSLREKHEVIVGKPLFLPFSYNEQLIEMDFDLPVDTTMDVVFQQQSFYTLGDIDGEGIPLQRRLLRLSSRSDVASGLSKNTGIRSAPFTSLMGNLKTKNNSLHIKSDNSNIYVTLNGEPTIFTDYKPLGYGLTGIMVYENFATINSIDVTSINSAIEKPVLLQFYFLFGLLIAVFVIKYVLRTSNNVSFLNIASILSISLWPLSVFLIIFNLFSPNDLLVLGDNVALWVAMLVAGTLFNLLYFLILYRFRYPAVFFNIIIISFLILVMRAIWLNLPDNHAFRKYFNEETLNPGSGSVEISNGGGPWYTNNNVLLTNIWVWKQRFGGEELAVGTPKDRPRMFVIGGSQAWGSGASSSNTIFSELIEKQLSSDLFPVDIFNASMNAAGVSSILQTNIALLPQFDPDIIILDIGTNDSVAYRMMNDKESYLRTLSNSFSDFIHKLQKQGAAIILVIEPMALETFGALYPEPKVIEQLKSIAAANGVIVIDPKENIFALEKDHIIWWDMAHLTPYGHALMAKQITPVIKQVLVERSQTTNNN